MNQGIDPIGPQVTWPDRFCAFFHSLPFGALVKMSFQGRIGRNNFQRLFTAYERCTKNAALTCVVFHTDFRNSLNYRSFIFLSFTDSGSQSTLEIWKVARCHAPQRDRWLHMIFHQFKENNLHFRFKKCNICHLLVVPWLTEKSVNCRAEVYIKDGDIVKDRICHYKDYKCIYALVAMSLSSIKCLALNAHEHEGSLLSMSLVQVATFSKDVNPWLDKQPLKFNNEWRYSQMWLSTFLDKTTTGSPIQIFKYRSCCFQLVWIILLYGRHISQKGIHFLQSIM